MVRLNPLLATAILSFGTTTTLGAPATTNNAWVHPIYIGDASIASAAQADNAPVPQVHEVTAADLAPFSGTELHPSNLTDSATAAAAAPLDARGIIGADNRVLWNNQDYPYSAMGRIQNSDGSVCSGALIGRRAVATAKHCIPGSGATSRFQPNYYDGERHGGSQVTNIISVAQGDGACFQKEDWAIFILADPLGDNFGYLGAKQIDCDAQKNRAMFFHLGYPGDHGTSRPYRQEGITVTRCADCAPGGPLETDADGIPGQSGGPLWINENGSRFQYGVLSGTSDTGSGFASGPNFVNAVAKARNDYP